MHLFLIALSFFVFGSVSVSVASAQSLCSLDAAGFQQRLSISENRLGFSNPPGPLKTGLCWWHSRFQRNANYLFEGNTTPAVTSDPRAVSNAIAAIIKQRGIVSVPGYANLQQFSNAHYREIAEALGQWQLVDSTINFGWVKGLQGSAKGDATQMQREVLGAMQKVKQGQVVFQMLQIPGFEAHAWLVYDALQWGTGSFAFSVVDSNMPLSNQSYRYTLGMQNMFNYLGSFSPITQRENELRKSMKQVIDGCQKRGTRSLLQDQMKAIFGG